MSETDQLNALTESIIGSAIAVHHELGPGMLESAYDACLTYELLTRGHVVEKCKVGLLFNFSVKWLTHEGVKRVVNGFPE
jgi:PD-(D/E)XK nuclease superfamily